MRVQLVRQTYHQRYGTLAAGQVVDVPDEVGQHWLARGIASLPEGPLGDEVLRGGEGGDVRAPEGAGTVTREDAAPLIPEDAPGPPVGRTGPTPRRRRTRRA